jgi:sortase (surface protein transpeptidase)
MSALVMPRERGSWTRVVACGAVAATLMIAIVSFLTAVPPAFADVHRLEIRSDSLVGSLPGGALAPARRIDPPTEPATMAAVVEPVPAASEAPVTPTSPAMPAAPVMPAAPATPAPVVNVSNCRSDIAGPVMTITIPDISYSCPVYAGGQKMLNSGAVTQISDDSIISVLADHPGGHGLLWIAAHRTSHGGAFAAVPNLADGALITMSDGTYTATYKIVGRKYVTIKNDRVVDDSGHATSVATLNSIIRPDHGGNGASRLLLQTCDGEDHRWMIYADLVTP